MASYRTIPKDTIAQLLKIYCDTGYNICMMAALISICVCIYGMVKDKPKLTIDSLAILGFVTLLGILTYLFL